MTPQMKDALYRLSLCYDPDPGVIYRRIVETIAEIYQGTMAMINLIDGADQIFREVVNPHPAFVGVTRMPLESSYCIFALRRRTPLLMQNVAVEPELCNHPAVGMGLCRYLGVPISGEQGDLYGTLCLLDGATEDLLGEGDIEFFSLLALRVRAEVERERILLARMSEEHRLSAENARFAAFIASTADAILSFDAAGKISTWNNGAERMFGYTAEEAIGQSYTLIGTPEVYDFQHRIYQESLRGAMHKWYDTRRRHKNGAMIDVSITTSPLMIEGTIKGLVAIVRDISERVRTAEELRQRTAQLDAYAQQMADLNAQLQAQAEEKRRFVNMVIHDLRHPLTTMRTVLYLLRNDESAIQREEYLEVVEGRVTALANLLNELTEYHRIEAGRAKLHITPVDVGLLIRDCVGNFAPALIGGQVRILCEVEANPGIIAMDGSKLTHILLNLLSNALKFTSQGTITVAARPEGEDHWSLSVEDTGQGMMPEVQSRVYEEFYQGETSHRQSGSGLGLSIARQLCNALHGKMELTSVYGRGTKFRLIFPYRFDEGSE